MRIAQLNGLGTPSEVVDCVEVEDCGAPGPGEVTVDVAFCPINPADLLMIEGRYATRPEVPSPLGIEGAGRVAEVGEGVDHLTPGDPVMCLSRTNWADKVRVPAAQAVPLAADVDLQQAAMLKVNPATAQLMLRSYVTLSAGDWVVQNAANSGVGKCLIRLARAQGVKTVNVVRRADLVEPLTAIGADAVVVDGHDLGARVRTAVGDGAVRLAIDAIGGTATRRLGDCLDDGGTIVNYGLLSGEPCQVTSEQLVFRGLTATGFWLAKLLRGMPPEEVAALYKDLSAQISEGALYVDVEKVYPLTEIKAALAHAGQEGRGGKILLAPGR